MPLSANHHIGSSHTTLSVTGRFTFGMHREFNQLVNTIDSRARQVTVDLSRAEYMDSAGLGLLLQMHGKLRGARATLKVRRDSLIYEILDVVKFEQFFKIEAV